MNKIKNLIFVMTAGFSIFSAADCPRPGEYQAADLSQQVNQTFLNKMREIGVHTIIRYYDDIPETISGKTLRLRERNLIQRSGFSLVAVFQHFNGRLSSFTEARGIRDAERSLYLSNAMSQPRGSAIYFGVDNSWSRPADLEKIKTYFRAAKPLINRAGYKIGGYGSGLVCKTLLDSRLVEFCWLSNATGWPGFQSFLSSRRWSMQQFLPRTCAGKEADFNKTNPSMPDFGQFN